VKGGQDMIELNGMELTIEQVIDRIVELIG